MISFTLLGEKKEGEGARSWCHMESSSWPSSISPYRPPGTPKPVQWDLDTHSSHRSKVPEASCFAEIARRYRQDNTKYPPALCKLQAPCWSMPGERSGRRTTVSPLAWGSWSHHVGTGPLQIAAARSKHTAATLPSLCSQPWCPAKRRPVFRECRNVKRRERLQWLSEMFSFRCPFPKMQQGSIYKLEEKYNNVMMPL